MQFNRVNSFLSSMGCSLCTGIRNNFDLLVPNSKGRRTLIHRILWIFHSLWPIFKVFVTHTRFEAPTFLTTVRNIFCWIFLSHNLNLKISVCFSLEICHSNQMSFSLPCYLWHLMRAICWSNVDLIIIENFINVILFHYFRCWEKIPFDLLE